MNQTIESFARQQIIDGCESLPENWQNTFKLMYGRMSGRRSVEDAKAMTIREVVAEIPADKLDWALQQIENSHTKISKQEATA